MADSFFTTPRSLVEQRPEPHPQRTRATAASGKELPARLPADNRRLKLMLIVIIAIMGLIVVGEVVFQLAIAPQLLLQRVSLDSDLNLAQADILAAAGVALNERFYALDPELIQQRLAGLPAVGSVRVETVFPDTLVIHLQGRQPVAIALVTTADGVQQPVQIDSLGFIFAWGLPSGQDNLPVLSGVEFRNFHIGMQLPQSVVPFLQDLLQLRIQSPALYRAFSEFKLQPVGTTQLEILAYTVNSPVPVRLNARLSEERALYTLRAMEMLDRTEGLSRIREIDFRTNNVVYTKGVD